jgi:hypothetical protein
MSIAYWHQKKEAPHCERTLKEINGVTSKFMRGVLLDAFIVRYIIHPSH